MLQETDLINFYFIKPSVSNSLKDYNFLPYSTINRNVLRRDKISTTYSHWFYKWKSLLITERGKQNCWASAAYIFHVQLLQKVWGLWISVEHNGFSCTSICLFFLSLCPQEKPFPFLISISPTKHWRWSPQSGICWNLLEGNKYEAWA